MKPGSGRLASGGGKERLIWDSNGRCRIVVANTEPKDLITPRIIEFDDPTDRKKVWKAVEAERKRERLERKTARIRAAWRLPMRLLLWLLPKSLKRKDEKGKP